MLETLRRTIRLIGREGRARWGAVVVLAVLASVIEMAGAGLIYAFLDAVATPGDGIELPLFGDLTDRFPESSARQLMLALAGVVGVFFVFRGVAAVAITYAKQRLGHRAGAQLAATLVRGYLTMPYAHHLQRNSSELVRNAHTQVKEVAQKGFLQAINVVAESVMVLALTGVMVAIAPLATLLTVGTVGAAALLLLRVVQPRLRRQGAISQQMEQRTLGTLQQSLEGVRDVHVLGVQEHFAVAYRDARDRQARALYLKGTAAELPRHVVETALIGTILLLFVVGLSTGAEAAELIATLGLFAYIGLRLMPSLHKLLSGLNHLRFMGPAIDDIVADLELVEPHLAAHVPTPVDGARASFASELRLDDVSFTYEGASHPALDTVAVSIRPGELIGICGPTGGGKTTLTDLLTGLLHPTTGRVLLDGTDLAAISGDWRRRLGVVPQSLFLVDDTLRRNIALGVPDEDIDDEALEEALELAQLGPVVAGLEDGLETVVGERGIRLSGGQRQRVAIARALYRRPDVLIFDEGTSALDNATESVLMGSLEQLRGRHTIVLVAHRLSTVRNCDRILYLEGGRISGEGTYDVLQRDNAGFRALTAER